MTIAPPGHRPGSHALPSRIDMLLGVLLVAWTLAAAVLYKAVDPQSRGLDLFGVVLVIMISGSITVRRRPLAAVTVCVAALVPYNVVEYARLEIVLPAVAILLYTVAVAGSRSRTTVTGLVVTLAVLGSTWFTADGWPGGDSVETVGWIVAALAFGEATRSRRAYAAAVEERAARAEHTREEEARRRVAEERLRIARDLHDVLAHNIAVISMQSSVAAHVIDERGNDPMVRELSPPLRSIAAASGATLSELRSMLGVLRDLGPDGADRTDGGNNRDPVPGLNRLDELITSARVAGVQVDVHEKGARRTLPTPVDITAYRIIQEALTNVARHAAGARTSVVVDYRPGELHLRITDGGGRQTEPVSGTGFGLAGMAERAEAVRGVLSAGPLPDRGFAVEASLPTATEPLEPTRDTRARG